MIISCNFVDLVICRSLYCVSFGEMNCIYRIILIYLILSVHKCACIYVQVLVRIASTSVPASPFDHIKDVNYLFCGVYGVICLFVFRQYLLFPIGASVKFIAVSWEVSLGAAAPLEGPNKFCCEQIISTHCKYMQIKSTHFKADSMPSFQYFI